MADQQFNTTVNIDITKFNDNLKKIQDQLKSLQDQLDKTNEKTKNSGKVHEDTGLSMGKLAGAIGLTIGGYELLYKGVEKVVDAMKESISNAMKEETTIAKLNLALDGSNEATGRMVAFRKELLETTIFEKSDIDSAINYALGVGRSEEETRKMVKAAIELSNATGGLVTVDGAMVQLQGTYEGNLGRLKKYTGELSKEQLKNGEAVDKILEKYGKFLGSGMDTTEGKVIQAKKSWEEFSTSIGTIVLPVIGKLADAFSAMMGNKNAELRLREQARDQYIKDSGGIKNMTEDQKKNLAVLNSQILVLKTANDLESKRNEIAAATANIASMRKNDVGSKYYPTSTATDAAAIKDQEKINKNNKDKKKEQEKIDEEKIKEVQKTQKEIDDVISKSNENNLKHDQNLNSEIKLDNKEAFDQQLQGIKDLTDQKVQAKTDELNKLRSFVGPETEQGAALRAAKEKELEGEIVLIKDDGNKAIMSNDKAYFDWENQQNQQALDDAVAVEHKKQEAAKKTLNDHKKMVSDIKSGAIQVAGAIANDIFGSMNQQIQNQSQNTINELDKQYTAEDDNLNKMKSKKMITDAQYNEKKAKLDEEKATKEKKVKTDAAKKEREAQVLQAIVNTALGVTAALTMQPAGYVLAAVTAAMGAVEIANMMAQPLPQFGMGGMIPKKYAVGGMVMGASHSNGGVPVELEGGEYVVNRKVVSQPNMVGLLDNINRGLVNNSKQSSGIDANMVANAVIASVQSIPVNVSEKDITRTQKKVSVILNNASW